MSTELVNLMKVLVKPDPNPAPENNNNQIEKGETQKSPKGQRWQYGWGWAIVGNCFINPMFFISSDNGEYTNLLRLFGFLLSVALYFLCRQKVLSSIKQLRFRSLISGVVAIFITLAFISVLKATVISVSSRQDDDKTKNTILSATDWFQGANSKCDLEDYKGAIADFTKAISLKPEYVDAYIGRGGAKLNLKDYQGAIADFTKAISLNPDYAAAYVCRGNAKALLEDYQGAIAEFTKAIGLKPNYATAYSSRGLAKDNLEDYQGAIADYTNAISLEPDYAAAYAGRGKAYLGLYKKSEAKADFMKAIELGYRVPQNVLDMCR